MAKLKFNDEGVIYNSLKILRQVEPRITKAGNKEARVEAECLLCGKVKNLSWSKVKAGHTKTCGCASFGKRKDLSGQRFGLLTAIESLGVTKNKSVLWKCVCDCGTVKNYTTSTLKGLNSCGCAQYKGRHLDLVGKRSGRLTAKEPVGKNRAGQYMWKCLCDCGNEHITSGTSLVENTTKSCGCLAKEVCGKSSITHGLSGTPEYGAWKNAVARCNDSRNKKYYDYGGRGISVCDRWVEDAPKGFLNFLEDMGERPSDRMSLDRIDVNGNYCPENCRWIDPYVQAYNTRMFKNNTSGRTGVSETKDGKWQAYITHKNVRKSLGVFATLRQAVNAREQAEILLHGEIKEMK